MFRIIQRILGRLNSQKSKDEIIRQIIRAEAQLGAKLFVEPPEGHRRDFFCLDKDTWVWHEYVHQPNGQEQVYTVRYDVVPEGIYKSQDGMVHVRLEGEELINFYRAVKNYKQYVQPKAFELIRA